MLARPMTVPFDNYTQRTHPCVRPSERDRSLTSSAADRTAEEVAVPERWTSFVALGDSFTEGLNDLRPDGSVAGWADRVAEALAIGTPGFRYANLAIRGLGLGHVVDSQVPAALAMGPDL